METNPDVDKKFPSRGWYVLLFNRQYVTAGIDQGDTINLSGGQDDPPSELQQVSISKLSQNLAEENAHSGSLRAEEYPPKVTQISSLCRRTKSHILEPRS
jgi:hypothetical protein